MWVTTANRHCYSFSPTDHTSPFSVLPRLFIVVAVPDRGHGIRVGRGAGQGTRHWGGGEYRAGDAALPLPLYKSTGALIRWEHSPEHI